MSKAKSTFSDSEQKNFTLNENGDKVIMTKKP